MERHARNAVDSLREAADEHTYASIMFGPTAQRPRAREIADLFELAGWKYRFNDIAQETMHGYPYREAVEVIGLNGHLVKTIANALSQAGIIAVRQIVKQNTIDPNNPKFAYVARQVEVHVGHPPVEAAHAQDVFVVHGHDNATRNAVSRFIQQITGREPVILHEQPNSGRTVIEKFEQHARSTGFAVILLTGDDEGKTLGTETLALRARQNVVLELGFFVSALGRQRVAALHEAGVELPSDISGMLYTSLESDWKMELAREMRAAGVDVDLNKAL